MRSLRIGGVIEMEIAAPTRLCRDFTGFLIRNRHIGIPATRRDVGQIRKIEAIDAAIEEVQKTVVENFATVNDDSDFALPRRIGRPYPPNTAWTVHFSEDFFTVLHADVAATVVIGVPLEVFASFFVIFAAAVIAGELRHRLAFCGKRGKKFHICQTIDKILVCNGFRIGLNGEKGQRAQSVSEDLVEHGDSFWEWILDDDMTYHNI